MHKTPMSWSFSLVGNYILAYLDLVEIAQKACKDFEAIAQYTAGRREELLCSRKVAHEWRGDPSQREKLDSIREADAKDEDGGGADGERKADGGGADGGEADEGGGGGDGFEEDEMDEDENTEEQDNMMDEADNVGYVGDVGDENEEMERKKRLAEEFALIDEAEALAEDLLDGKVIGEQPLTAKSLKAKEMYAADLVEVGGQEPFSYVKEWTSYFDHGPGFKKAISA